jgi:hypothetical protein
MNDHHYHDKPHRSSVFLRENPECRMGNRFDYNHPKVRRHFLALIEEVLQRYDMDGIELDWRRTAPPAPLNDLEKANRSLAEFMREVRKVTDAAAERRGHPVFIAVRVLETPEFSRRSALDAVSWAREGRIDVIIPSPFFGTMATDLPIKAWRKAVGETDRPIVLVAGTDHYIRAYPGAKEIRLTAAINRGFTAAMLHRGADAVYLFNQWNRANMQYTPVSPGLTRGDPRLVMVKDEHREALTTTGRMETALSLPRRHIISYREGPARGAPNPRQLPRKLSARKPEPFTLATGPARNADKVTLRIGVEGLNADSPDPLTAQVNASNCRPIADVSQKTPLATMTIPGQANDLTRIAPRVVQFEVPTQALQDGDNRVTLQTAAANQPRVVWVEMLIEP